MADELVLVSCTQCQKFTPDHIGNGSGIGQCSVYEAQLSKHQDAVFDKELFRQLGNKNFWGGTSDKPDRNCRHYVGKYAFTVGD